MDSKQLHSLMKLRRSVSYDGQKYDRIVELVSWYDINNQHHLSAVLLSGRNTVRVPADKVEAVEGL